MACCRCCCGGVDCAEGDQGKCCCGGPTGTCCTASEYCCSGVCQATPCAVCIGGCGWSWNWPVANGGWQWNSGDCGPETDPPNDSCFCPPPPYIGAFDGQSENSFCEEYPLP